MSSNCRVSIESLPVEIFYRIFDFLDSSTILLSFQLVCKFFRSIISGYNRYKFDCKILSKSDFHRLCQLIPPERLISLTLYHDEQIPNQISFFISNYRLLRQLTRLRSINLFGINECHFNFIFKRINSNHLISFRLHIQNYDEQLAKTTGDSLSSILAQSTLRRIELNIRNERLSKIQWSSNCRIECFIINNSITTKNLFRMIECFPRLHTLVLKEGMKFLYDDRCSFPQITSLTLENSDTSIDDLELFLSLTPSLVYFKLVGQCLFNGQRWEEFIQINLPHLNQFEFFVDSMQSYEQIRGNLETIIQSFQSPFWIEHKKWFVGCEYDGSPLRKLQIYSLPVCKTIFNEQSDSEICFLSTSKSWLNVENINEIHLQSIPLVKHDRLRRIDTPFPNINKLYFEIFTNTWIDSINALQSIFLISNLVEVHLKCTFNEWNKDLLFATIKLIEQSSRLTCLTIRNRLYYFGVLSFIKDLCSILPCQIKYLEMPISQVEEVEMIFERCRYLSIIKFEMTYGTDSMKIEKWFDKNTIDSIFERRYRLIHVWIGNRINQINENSKRIKFMENQSN